MVDEYPNAVKNEDGSLAVCTLRIQGRAFFCECGANVFHKPDRTKPDVYACNGCGTWYTAAEAPPEVQP